MESGQSNALKVAGAAVGGGTLVGAGLMATMMQPSAQTLAAFAAGVAAIVLVLVAYVFVVKMRGRQRAAAADRSLLDVMRVRPRSVNDPALIAKLDQLGEKFEEGVEKYHRATGQRVSASPWYLLVGESGSGKTEAIRNCGVEFPSGLHEEQQGAGGTTNMDWWFTEEAIILDTAGRYALDAEADRAAQSLQPLGIGEEGEPDRPDQLRAQTEAEWGEFLKLVNKARPNCPINGMLLVIPATSLIKDDADDIQRKAKNLSKFLDTIRRTLEVRFPVFVLVTKSDLIPGFREFFEHISDPELQQQMLGWTKPGTLDEPFNPDEVDEYLQSIRDKLVRRRLTLMQDPVHSEVPGARRLDEVDALFTFPDRFAELAPKLRRYLQTVFVRSKFNQTPLFLRGIYFTSSMEAGAALDETLARIRGITMQQLEDEQRNWRRDRPVFLRELFMRKVFAEQGLVTRESNVGHAKRRRQLITYGTGIAATVVLIGLAYLSYRQLKGTIADESVLARALANARTEKNHADAKPVPTLQAQWDLFAYNAARPATGPAATTRGMQFVYQGLRTVTGDDLPRDKTLGWYYTERVAAANRALTVPTMFAWLPSVQGAAEPNALRRQAAVAMFDAHVLRPLIVRAGQRLATPKPAEEPQGWRPGSPAFAALRTLLAIDSERAKSPVKDAGEIRVLDALADFTVDRGSFDSDQRQALEKSFDEVRGNDQSAVAHAAGLLSDDHELAAPIAGGIGQFSRYWKAQFTPGSAGPLAAMDALVRQLSAFDDAYRQSEKSLSGDAAQTRAEYLERRQRFEDGLKRLRDQSQATDLALAALRADPFFIEAGSAVTDGSLTAMFESAVAQLRRDATRAHEDLLAATENNGIKNQIKASRDEVNGLQGEAGFRELKARLAGVEQWCAAPRDGGPSAYATAVAAMTIAQGQLPTLSEGESTPLLADANAVKGELARAAAAIDALPVPARRDAGKPLSADSPAAQAGERATSPAKQALAKLALPAQRYRLLQDAILGLPKDAEQLSASIAQSSGGERFHVVPLRPLPLQDEALAKQCLPLMRQYDPGAANEMFDRFEKIAAATEADGPDSPLLDRDALRQDCRERAQAVQSYGREYVAFWSKGIEQYVRPVTPKTWREFQQSLAADLSLPAYEAGRDALRARRQAALKAINLKRFDELDRARSARADEFDPTLSAFTPAAGQEVSAAVAYWDGLPDDDAAATQKLLDTPAGEFARVGFRALRDQPYLREVALNGLRTLAARKDGGAMVARLAEFERKFAGKFPVNTLRDEFPGNVANAILPEQDWRAARDAVNALLATNAGGAKSASGESESPLIKEGGQTSMADVNVLLNSIYGAPISGETRARLTRSLKLLDVVVEAQRNPTLQYQMLIILPPGNERNAIGEKLQYMQVTRDGTPLRPEKLPDFLNGKEVDLGTLRWQPPTPAAVRFNFYGTDNATNTAAARPAAFTEIRDDRLLALQLLAQSDARTADGLRWEFPLRVWYQPPGKPKPEAFVQWFAIVFKEPTVPKGIEWPVK